MRLSLTVALVLVMVGIGSHDARAQERDEGWWTWATPLVSSQDGRVAVPREQPGERDTSGARDRTPPAGRDERAGEATRRPDAQAPPTAGRGRGAQRTPQGGRQGGGGGRGVAAGRGSAGVPAFCRTGAGHPVFGWPWCEERGFGSYRPQWQRQTWSDATPRWPRQPREGRLDDRALGSILGDVIFGRVRSHANSLDATAPLEGRWVRPGSGALVLQVRAGEVPVAELSDTNGDGRPDVVIVNRTRR